MYVEQFVMAYGIEQDRIPCTQVLGPTPCAFSGRTDPRAAVFQYERESLRRVPVRRQKEKKWFL